MEFWIARDKSGYLGLYWTFKLVKEEDRFEGEHLELNSTLFPEVTFENSPQKIVGVKLQQD